MWRAGGRLRQLEVGRGARLSARLPPGAGMPRKAGAASKASGEPGAGGGRAALSLQGASRSRTPAPRAPAGPVAADAAGSVTVAVRARPGARASAVTGLTAEAVCVAVAAPPSEGEANAELCRYLSRVLGLRKSDVVLDKGGKSRDKVVKLLAPTTPEETLEKLKMQVEKE